MASTAVRAARATVRERVISGLTATRSIIVQIAPECRVVHDLGTSERELNTIQPFLEKIRSARATHPLLRSATVSLLTEAKMNTASVPLIARIALPSAAIIAWSPTPAIGAELVNRCRPLEKKLAADSPVAIWTETMSA